MYTPNKYLTELKDFFQEDMTDRKMAKAFKDEHPSDPHYVHAIYKQSIKEDLLPHVHGKRPNYKKLGQGLSRSSPSIYEPP